MTLNLNLVKRVPENKLGRDFVIGDLHGAISTFLKLLIDLNFDPAVDRMFSVGDLVDRGEDSLACLRLIEEPWFYAVKANHEDMMIGAIKGYAVGEYWVPRNGSGWSLDYIVDITTAQEITKDTVEQKKLLSNKTLAFLELVEKADQLPLMISIDGPVKTHVIHAEIDLTLDASDEVLEDDDRAAALLLKYSAAGFLDVLWHRRLFGPMKTLDLVGSGIEKSKRAMLGYLKRYRFDLKISNNRFISGHTILSRPTKVFNRICIDTGAYGDGFANPDKHDALTCVQLGPELTYFQSTKTDFRQVTPFEITMQDLNDYAAEH